MILSLIFASTSALATTTWYVNGVTGSDSNNCVSPATACRTIGHAISLSSSGDSVKVAAATYSENLTIGLNLTITGADAGATIIDGGGAGRVIAINSGSAKVTLSSLTIRNGRSYFGAGVFNAGTLYVNDCTISGNVGRGMPGLGAGVGNAGTVTISNSTNQRQFGKRGFWSRLRWWRPKYGHSVYQQQHLERQCGDCMGRWHRERRNPDAK